MCIRDRDELVQDKDTNSGTGKTEGTTTPETEKKIATVRSACLLYTSRCV